MNNKEIEIRNPLATRPWQHVLEPLSGYMLLAKKLYENPDCFTSSWNFGPSIDSIKTVKELAEKTFEILGKGSISINKTEKHKHEAGLLHLNCDKSNYFLGWNPVWGFDQTVKTTVEWYKNYLKGDDPEKLSLENINKYMEDSKL
jgi:CDP-glucose 4,6-dehydratase